MTAKKKKRVFPILLLLLALAAGVYLLYPQMNACLGAFRVERLGLVQIPDWIEPQILDIDGTSRRGEKLEDLQNIVIHYVGNPGTTARQNRAWYANPDSEVSSHFLVGLDGEILQCIPLTEKSSASNHRNRDTISIEVCHPDDTGKFGAETYAALVRLTAWLVEQTHLQPEDVIRHYDITGKECPRYFVRNTESWRTFLGDVARAVEEQKS